MAIQIDPEENEVRALAERVDFSGRRVLEIGCGDGRLTWRYAHRAARVTAIDPYAHSIARASQNMPAELRDRVELRNIAFEDFAAQNHASYDIALLSWSLC